MKIKNNEVEISDKDVSIIQYGRSLGFNVYRVKNRIEIDYWGLNLATVWPTSIVRVWKTFKIKKMFKLISYIEKILEKELEIDFGE